MRAAGPGCGLAEQAFPRAQLGWAESGRGLLRWPQPVKHSASFSFFFQKHLNNCFAQLLNSI
jgi:hypothetical protein